MTGLGMFTRRVAIGRHDSVTTGSYLASGLSGSNLVARLKESPIIITCYTVPLSSAGLTGALLGIRLDYVMHVLARITNSAAEQVVKLGNALWLLL
jgi:hypothetical protein